MTPDDFDTLIRALRDARADLTRRLAADPSDLGMVRMLALTPEALRAAEDQQKAHKQGRRHAILTSGITSLVRHGIADETATAYLDRLYSNFERLVAGQRKTPAVASPVVEPTTAPRRTVTRGAVIKRKRLGTR
jgi:hypothetical protein